MLQALVFGLRRVRPSGYVVIEDIPEAAEAVWKVAASLLPAGHSAELVEVDGSLIFVVRRPAANDVAVT